LGVALIVIYVSVQLGWRSVSGLMDTAPHGAAEKVQSLVQRVPGVVDCDHVRVRSSGADLFVEMTVRVGGDQSLAAAHAIADRAEQAVQSILPRADVIVHTEPAAKRRA
jgi:divalent metal cation (Fe/Co/Zn/Cd) transporter